MLLISGTAAADGNHCRRRRQYPLSCRSEPRAPVRLLDRPLRHGSGVADGALCLFVAAAGFGGEALRAKRLARNAAIAARRKMMP